MSDDALVLIAGAHLMPGCDATVVDANADGVTVKTETGEHRVPRASPNRSTSRVAEVQSPTGRCRRQMPCGIVGKVRERARLATA